MTVLNRRNVLFTGGVALAHASMPFTSSATPTPTPTAGSAAADLWPSFPSTDPELVGAVVGGAHTDIDAVEQLVTAHPALARASIDWGFGDWESALGAASHMGRRDIAELLIAHGARPNLFSAAMFGQLDVVRAFVVASPGVQRIPGPHGITLLSHARGGGEEAAPVVEYLEGLGDADIGAESIEMTAAQRQRFVGTFVFGTGSNDALEVAEARDALTVKRPEAPFGRRLFPVSDREFFPSGSPAVRIAFELEGNRATTLQVIDNEVLVTATRGD